MREFDYPRGDENVYTRYGGDGGVPLSSFWRRLLYAWLEFDVGILVSDYIGPESRIQFWRAVQERIGKLAPFLELDPDPYVVVNGVACSGSRTPTPSPAATLMPNRRKTA